ncbi:MAG: 1,4-alpha-glucan branching protein GlgB [Anaerolineae bacterium]
MTGQLHPDGIQALVHGYHGSPVDILGVHQTSPKKLTIRAFRPYANELYLLDERKDPSKRVPMKQINEAGLYEASVMGTVDKFVYSFVEVDTDGHEIVFKDPYVYPFYLTEFDLYLHAEGRNWEIYEKLGAHLRTIDGVLGVNFAVWAPNAKRVSVIGAFNRWDGRVHPMQPNANSGVWELFIPGVAVGEAYKYEVQSHHMGYMAEKIDPYGFHAELRPNTASIVADLSQYQWDDVAWMSTRSQKNMLEEPMSIYEVHLGSWQRKEGNEWLTYRELADRLVNYVSDMGYTHIELMPVAEHPFDGSWGYQVTGYYAPTSRFGTPEDFMYFVDQCHQAGIGVIVDWVPAHFPKDGHALSFFDGTHLYSHEDARQGEHPDWGTYIFNYGRNEVRNFLIANALFWLEYYHIDGLRVDAVSSMVYLDFSREDGQWIPNQYGGNENLAAVDFLKETNVVIHDKFPGAVTIAEESTAWPMVSRPTYIGGLGFTFKWNMGWMHDTLSYFQKNPVYRKWEHNKLTFSMVYAFNENFVLSLSHDEVVHGKGSLMGKLPGDWWQKFAQLRLLMGYQYMHPGKKLNFMGSDIAQWTEWNEARSLDWHLMDMETHQTFNKFMKDLNHLYQQEPALYQVDFTPDGFRWIDANDAENSTFTFIRYAKNKREFVVVSMNSTPVPRLGHRVGVPHAGYYSEILNSDSEIYGGSNVGNMGGVHSESIGAHGFEQSLSLSLPPMGIVVMKYYAS